MKNKYIWLLCILLTLACWSNNVAAQVATENTNPPAEASDTDELLDWAGGVDSGTDEQWLLEVPELPGFSGWYCHLGVDYDGMGVLANESIALITGLDKLRAIDLATGEQLWETDYGGFGYDVTCLLSDDRIAVWDGALTVLDPADGSVLWEHETACPVGMDDGCVWTLSGAVGENYEGVSYSDVLRLDSTTGETIASHTLDMIRGAGCSTGDGPGGIAVKANGSIMLIDGSGVKWTVDAVVPGGIGQLLIDNGVVYSLECELPEIYADGTFEEYNPGEWQAALTAYSHADGSMLWREDLPGFMGVMATNQMLGANAHYVTLNLHPGLAVFNAGTGEMEYLSPAPEGAWGLQWLAQAGGRVYWSGEAYSGSTSIECFTPGDGGHEPLPGFEGINVKDIAVSGDRLIVLGETYPSAHDYWGANGHLFMLDLDEKGKPVAGEPAKLNLPGIDTTVIAAFMDAADPGMDTAVIDGIRSGGINAFNLLLDRLGEMNDAQLTATATLALDMTEYDPEAWYQYSPAQLLVDQLRLAGKESMSACVINLLDDPGFSDLHPALTGVLAACGGSAAKAWLDNYYGSMTVSRHEGLKAPFTVNLREGYFGDHNQWQYEPGSFEYAKCDDGEGGSLIAYVSDGLASERMIYIGFDRDNDLAYESIVPTGLTHTFFYCVHPGGPISPLGNDAKNRQKLSLELKDGQLLIGHYVPVITEVSHDYPGGTQKSLQMTGADFTVTTLKLEDVTLDTDGDGLTDITEAQLLTDANNPDTDGDGLDDNMDACPKADPAGSTKLGRGIARGLAYYFQLPTGYPGWWHPWDYNHPIIAKYIAVDPGIGPVSFSAVDKVYGICLSSEEEVERYTSLLDGYNPFSLAKVNIIDRTYLDSYIKSMMEEASVPEDDLEMAYIQASSTFNQMMPEYATHMLTIDLSLHGYTIYLVEIDGELYPVKGEMSWIS